MQRIIPLLIAIGLLSACTTAQARDGIEDFFNGHKTGLEEVHYIPGGPCLWQQEAELYRAWHKNHDYPMPPKYLKGAWMALAAPPAKGGGFRFCYDKLIAQAYHI